MKEAVVLWKSLRGEVNARLRCQHILLDGGYRRTSPKPKSPVSRHSPLERAYSAISSSLEAAMPMSRTSTDS